MVTIDFKNLDPNKTQAFILILGAIGGIAGWMMDLDLAPLASFIGVLVGATEYLKAKVKEDG